MAFTFRIVFSGICAFVSDRRIGSRKPPRTMTVLLPNAIEPSFIGTIPKGEVVGPEHILPPHYPLLQFNVSNLQSCEHQASHFTKEEVRDNKILHTGAMSLLGQDLALWPDGREPGSSLGSIRLIDTAIPEEDQDDESLTQDQRKSLRWLTSLSDIKPRSAIKPALLGSLRKDDEKLIAARVRFTTGRLSTVDLSTPKWQYLPVGIIPKDDSGKRVAIQLALELEVEEKMKLMFQPFGQPGLSKLIFAPSTDAPHDDVEVNIQNLEPNSFLGFPVDVDREKEGTPIDPDFSIYYQLVDLGEDDTRPVPQRLVQKGDTLGGGYGRPCSPVYATSKPKP
jgi:hypothetical protein